MSFPLNKHSKGPNEVEYGTSSAILLTKIAENGRAQWDVRSALNPADNFGERLAVISTNIAFVGPYSSRDCRYIVAPARRYYEKTLKLTPLDQVLETISCGLIC